MRRVLSVGALLWLAGALGAWAALYTDYFSPTAELFLGLSLPIWAALGLIVGLWALVQRRGWVVMLALLCAIGAAYQHGLRLLSPDAPERGEDFSLLSWNIFSAHRGFARVLEEVLQYRPDLILLQEVYNADGDLARRDPLRYGDFRQALRAAGYYVAFAPDQEQPWGAYGLLIASRWPLEAVRRLDLAGRIGVGIVADVRIGNHPLRLIGVHLYTTGQEKPWRGRSSWSRWRTWLRQMQEGYMRREAELRELLDIIRRSPYPVLVGGDFNTTPFSRHYVLLSRWLGDAHRHAGRGLGATYSTSKPLLRIDYQWFSSGLRPLEMRVLPDRASDHRPLLARWIFEP